MDPGFDPMTLPPGLPVPVDDGGADHLSGLVLPPVVLRSTSGTAVDVAALAADRCVLFIFPAMGRPGEEMPRGWDATPGARGCTPQSCAFRDRHDSFEELGYVVAGMSAQSEEVQAEAAQRLGLPFELLSDPELILASRLGLPIFEIAGMKLYKRLTLVAHRGVIAKVFYPVFPPQHNAQEVLRWLRSDTAATQ
ncbi:MAG: peroxiredoxin [Actinomycetota bacterium]|nr:peroxiredoxin [Actinomycetota bacterium]